MCWDPYECFSLETVAGDSWVRGALEPIAGHYVSVRLSCARSTSVRLLDNKLDGDAFLGGSGGAVLQVDFKGFG